MDSNAAWKRNTALFLVSQGVTLFGSSLVQFAMVWYVTKVTSSGAWVSALSICAFLPQMLISLVSGVWADRYPKKRLIVASDAVIAAATLALSLLLPYVSSERTVLTALLLVSVVRSLGAGVQTPAVNAVIPQLVPEEQLMRMNGVNATLQSVVQFAAPAAAGAILSFSSLHNALFIDVATAAAGIGLLCCVWIPAVRNEAAARKPVLDAFKAGVRYAAGDAFLGKLLALYGAFIFLCVPAGFLATLFVSRAYGDSYLNMTIVELVGFAGMAGGGALIGAWGGFPNRVRTLLVGLTAFGALAVGMGALHSFYAYLALMLLYGVALTMVQTAVTTLLQEKAAPEMQGRMFGFLNVIYCGFLPLGMAAFGPLADRMPMRWMLALSGAALLLLALVYRLLPGFLRAGETPEDA